MIRAVIWDFGGVLLRTEDYTPRDKLAESIGKKREELEYLLYAGESSRSAQSGQITWQAHLDYVAGSLGLQPYEMEDFLERFWKGDRLDADLLNSIRSLKKHYKMGLLSNAFENLRELIGEYWKFDDVFDKVIVSAEVGMMKPEARIYQLMLRELEVAAAEAVFVDDFLENVESAREVGLYAIHFKSPQQALGELEEILNGAC